MEGIILRGEDIVRVTLDNGYTLDYFVTDLTDEEYLKRTNTLYKMETGRYKDKYGFLFGKNVKI